MGYIGFAAPEKYAVFDELAARGFPAKR